MIFSGEVTATTTTPAATATTTIMQMITIHLLDDLNRLTGTPEAFCGTPGTLA